jgi:putative tryptophan/tyrosine transport system substrate-binding protein
MQFHQLQRRDFITLLGGAAAAWPLAAHAQRPALPVIGFLHSGSPTEWTHLVAAFNQGLNEGGFADGRNVTIEFQWANFQNDHLPALAADLVRRRVAVIAAAGGPASALAAKAATTTIPIVFSAGNDPIEDGLVTSLNRPDANVTGVAIMSNLLGAKRLELLHELVPPTAEVALLHNPTSSEREPLIVQAAANKLGRQLRILNVSNDRELDAALATILEQRIGGLLVEGEAFFTSRREQLILFTTRYAIPTVFAFREFTAAGGLMSYGASLSAAYRLMASYVARILKGEKPADLPVQQSTTLETVVNLKAARTLGLTVPPAILLRADEVIE